MPTWIIYAVLSMMFAGVTAVLAKYGLQSISADAGLGIRTFVIFIIVGAITLVGQKYREFTNLSSLQLWLLVLSGVTTTLSWVFYYRAIKEGPVSYVAVIDKGSIVITLLLSFVLLKEPMTPRIVVGALLIVAGMLVLVLK
jgi:transporter family protein